VQAKLYDPEIKRFKPFREVRRILLARSPASLSTRRLVWAALPFNQVRINPIDQL
jgi:hypothetical protein